MHSEKQLLLIMRHAESQSLAHLSRDFDRKLTTFGAEQAAKVAEKIVAKHIQVDKALISPSARTLQTWDILAQTLAKPKQILFDKRLYQATRAIMLDVIHEHAAHTRALLILAHCPAVQDVLYHVSGLMLDFATADVAILTPRHKDMHDCVYEPSQFDLIEMVRSHA